MTKMKEFDLVRLVDAHNYLSQGLYDNVYVVVLKPGITKSEILFFNDSNVEDTVKVTVLNNDLLVEKETLPDAIKNEIKKTRY